MSQIDLRPKVRVLLEGFSEPLAYTSLCVEQPLLEHHQCSLLWRLDQQKVMQTADRETLSQQCLGKMLHVHLGEYVYAYLVTSVEVQDRHQAAPGLLLKGYSPTILLDDIRQHQCYLNADLKSIAGEALADVPANLLSTSIEPVCTQSFAYTVQYEETDYAFLQRLSRRHGEFLYYDGKALVMGAPKTGGPTLVSGLTLNALHFKAKLGSAHAPYTRYDMLLGESAKEAVSFPSGGGADAYLSSAAGASEKLFRHSSHKQSFLFTGEEPAERAQFKHLKEQGYLSGLVEARGESLHPGLHPGLLFKTDQGHRKGEYIAKSVVHLSHQEGHYENAFVAMPSSCQVPAYTNPEAVPRARGEAQSAVVSSNADPEGLGRVKVNFHWNTSLESPWLRVVSPHGGGEKGFYFVPEVGEEVQVGFEQDNAERPFVLGSLYHGKAKPSSWKTDANNIKAIRTRSGNQVVMNDEDGSITMSDPSGNTVIMQGNGEIVIKAPNKLTLISTDINILASNSLNLAAKPGEDGGEGTIAVLAKKSFGLQVEEESIALQAKQDVSISSSDAALMLSAKTEASLLSEDAANVEGKSETNLLGQKINAKGGSQIRIESPDTDTI